MQRPAFEDLPLRKGDPKASAWGLWGDDDELGALNTLTPEVVRNASREVVHGRVVPLSLPLDVPNPPMNPARKKPDHKILHKAHPFGSNDDEVRFCTAYTTEAYC